jgi:hypothetical protein
MRHVHTAMLAGSLLLVAPGDNPGPALQSARIVVVQSPSQGYRE